MPKEELIVRPALSTDGEAIAQLFPNLPFKHELWEWQYIKNPASGSLEASRVACIQDQIIGFNGAMATTIMLDRKEAKAFWSVDFVVHPAFRGSGIGTMLKGALEDGQVTLLALGSSPAAQAVYRKRGWQKSDCVGEFFCQVGGLRPRALGKRIAQWCQRQIPTSTPGFTTSLVPVADVAAEAGLLWQEHCHGYRNAVCRTTEYIKWKYVHHPFAQYKAIRVDNTQGLLVGIGIIRVGRNETRLVDYVGPFQSIHQKNAIVAELLRYRTADSIHCLTTDQEFQRSLAAYGFLEYSAPQSFHIFRRSGDSLVDQEWFLLTGDSDADVADAAVDRTKQCSKHRRQSEV